MLETSARLLRLLSLLQMRREWAGPDAASYVSRAIFAEPYRYSARVTLHAPAEAILPQLGPATGLVSAVDDSSCRLENGADSLFWLAMLIAQLGVDFEVHEPPELIDHFRQLAERLTRATPPSGRATKARRIGRRRRPASGA